MSDYGQSPAGEVVVPCPLQKTTHWVEVEAIGADDSPLPYLAYRITLPDGVVQEGFLDGNGYARVEGVTQAGECQVCFPELDKDNWVFVSSKGARTAAS